MLFVKPDAIETFLFELLTKVGLNSKCARHTAKALTLANLRGVESHGIRLISHYVEAIKAGRINKEPNFVWQNTTSGIEILDADHAIGFRSGKEAMKKACKLAEQNGIGYVGVKNSSHGGMLAYYTMEAAKKGFITVTGTNTSPKMIPPNGTKGFLGTNPLSYAVPIAEDEVLCFDAATTQITGNKVKLYKNKGITLPAGVAADHKGVETQNPEEAVYLMPFGGYKGFGIALLIDILTGALLGMPNSENVSAMYGSEISKKRFLGQFFIAIDINKVTHLGAFKSILNEEIMRLRKSSKTGEISVPGDIELNTMKDRLEKGIPLDEYLVTELKILGRDLSINSPIFN